MKDLWLRYWPCWEPIPDGWAVVRPVRLILGRAVLIEKVA